MTGPTTTAPTTGPTTEDSTTSSGGATDTTIGSTSSEGSTTAVDSSSDGGETGEPCGPEARAIPPGPVGWTGVFALARRGPQGEPAMCPPPMLEGAEVIEGPASQCACTCDPGCWVNGFDVAACDQEPVDFDSGFDGTCMNFSTPDALHISLVFDDLANDGDCFNPIEQATIAADARYLECRHVSGEVCIPAPMDPGFLGPCIVYDDAVPCPAGPYSEQHVVAQGAVAACENCSPCFEEAVAACNGADAVVYPEANCGGLGVGVIDTTCSSELGRSVELDVALECPPSTPLPVTIQGERTFCYVP
jgi:hypothetical protein